MIFFKMPRLSSWYGRMIAHSIFKKYYFQIEDDVGLMNRQKGEFCVDIFMN